MKIIIEDFYHKGHYFDRFECGLPNEKIKGVSEYRVAEYVIDSLNIAVKFETEEES